MESILNFKPFIRMFFGKILVNIDERNIAKSFDMPYETDEEQEKCNNYRTRNLGLEVFGEIQDDARAYARKKYNNIDNQDLHMWHLHTYLYFKIAEMKIYRAICYLLGLDCFRE